MPPRIPRDSTVATVWPTLTHPEDYLSGVLELAERCRTTHGNAFVRIGITGSGQKPCYRVVWRRDDGTEEIFGSHWDNHQPLDNEKAPGTNWSTRATSCDELRALMLGRRPPKRPGSKV